MGKRLRKITGGMYEATGLLKTFVHFPLRMVVIDTGEGLWLHSPIQPDPELIEEVRALGTVRWLVSGSRFHHLFMGAWAALFDEAEVWRVEDLRAKDAAFPGIEPLKIEGAPRVDEVVFLHAASRTLVVTDLIFHINESDSLVSRLVFKMAGAFGKPAQSRLWRSWTKDRAAIRSSMEALLGWDFDRVVMAHGEVIDEDGHAVLKASCHWMLSAG